MTKTLKIIIILVIIVGIVTSVFLGYLVFFDNSNISNENANSITNILDSNESNSIINNVSNTTQSSNSPENILDNSTNNNSTSEGEIYKLSNEAENYSAEEWELLATSDVSITFNKDNSFILHSGSTIYYHGNYTKSDSNIVCNANIEEIEGMKRNTDTEFSFDILDNSRIKLNNKSSQIMLSAAPNDIFILNN